MFAGAARTAFILACALATAAGGASPTLAQEAGPSFTAPSAGSSFLPGVGNADAPLDDDTAPAIVVPGITSFAPPAERGPLALQREGELRLSAHMTEEGPEISRGLVWRVFRPEADASGRLPLVASSQGGSSTFALAPGSYLVHASFGRAGATKKITVSPDSRSESIVLDAGGLKLDAVLSGDVRIPPAKLRFSIYEAEADANGDRALIIPDVRPNTVVRLNSGTYHVVSTYGAVNAVIRSDIIVEAGKLTEATVEHKAAEMTLKLVREQGGEAIADTSWSVLTDSGDIIRESVGAFASMVLAEGDYAIVAKNRDRIYQRELTVVAGQNRDVEVLATE